MVRPTSKIGIAGEAIARSYLEKKGFYFIEANWSCKFGEIDLIMEDGYVRVFVEVRVRSNTSYGEGLDTIGTQKQQRLIRTAQAYQQQQDFWGDIRFDIVSIAGILPKNPHITHISDAFTL